MKPNQIKDLELQSVVWIKRHTMSGSWYFLRCFLLSCEPGGAIFTPFGLPGSHEPSTIDSIVINFANLIEGKDGQHFYSEDGPGGLVFEVFSLPGCLNYVPHDKIKVGKRYTVLGTTQKGNPFRGQIGVAQVIENNQDLPGISLGGSGLIVDYLDGHAEGKTESVNFLPVDLDGFMPCEGVADSKMCFLDYCPPSAGDPIDGFMIEKRQLIWLRINGFEDYPVYFRRAIVLDALPTTLTLAIQDDERHGEPKNPTGIFSVSRSALADYLGSMPIDEDAPIGSMTALPCSDDRSRFTFANL